MTRRSMDPVEAMERSQTKAGAAYAAPAMHFDLSSV